MNEQSELKIKRALLRVFQELIENHGMLAVYTEEMLDRAIKSRVEDTFNEISRVLDESKIENEGGFLL